MILNYLCSRLKAIVLVLLAAVNRAMCCFSRKRRNSFADEVVLQSVSVVNHSQAGRKTGENDRDWNSWDETPRTVDEHIEQYRQKLVHAAAATKEKEVAPAEDFFQDMAPKIITQTKVLLRTHAEQPDFSRLEAPVGILTAAGPDLEDWNDDENQSTAGWEELDDEHTKSMIREKRREQRAHLHQQQKSLRTSGQMFAERVGQRSS